MTGFLGGLPGAIWSGILLGIKHTVAIVVVFGIMLALGYFIMESNPELKKRFNGLWESIDEVTKSLKGISKSTRENNAVLEKLPELTEKLAEAKGSKASRLLAPAPGIEEVPNQLVPFLAALQNSKDYPRYVEMLSEEKIGKKGEGAVTILGKALKSDNPVLKEAATQSLKAIGTTEALGLLGEQKSNQVMKERGFAIE